MIAKQVNYKTASALFATALAKTKAANRLQTDFILQRSCLAGQEEMAAVLSEALASDKSIYVLNYLQLAHKDSVVHIDHLLLSPDALSIIDSQTTSCSVFTEENGSWARVVNDQRFSVQSPFELCDGKLEALIDYIAAQMHRFLSDRNVERETAFREYFRRQRFAALGPGAELAGLRPKSHTEIIRPARRLIDPLRAFHSFGKPKRPLFSFRKKSPIPLHILSRKELKALVDFLITHDSAVSPILSAARTISQRCRPLPPALGDMIRRIQEDTGNEISCDTMASDSLAVFHLCRECNSNRLQLELTEATRRFVCLECDAVTPVNVSCPQCGKDSDLLQRRRTIFIHCPGCRHERVFYVNPS